MNSVFNVQILTDKLSKLNSSRQCIETLSHWCIFHRNKAQEVVETWEREFQQLPTPQRVPFLYLANDILQNSRRRGSEFVNEFWRILPGVLKDVVERGDDNGRKVVWRLVDIWEERKVFGSKVQSLREELLRINQLPESGTTTNGTNDAIKVKVTAGGIQEKILLAYQSVHDVSTMEDVLLGRCNAAVVHVGGLEREANHTHNSEVNPCLAKDLQEQQNILVQCAEQLEVSEMARSALVTHLKEALREQETRLELVRIQLQIAQAKSGRAHELRQQILCSSSNSSFTEINQCDSSKNGSSISKVNAINSQLLEQSVGDTMLFSFESVTPMINERKSATEIAAEVAAKLAASTSSAQMLTSALSSLAAEEPSFRAMPVHMDPGMHSIPSDKRQKLDVNCNEMHDSRHDPPYTNSSYKESACLEQFATPAQLQLTPASLVFPHMPSTSSVHSFVFGRAVPPLPQAPPPPPPPPPTPPPLPPPPPPPPPPPSLAPLVHSQPLRPAPHSFPVPSAPVMVSPPQKLGQPARMGFYCQMPMPRS